MYLKTKQKECVVPYLALSILSRLLRKRKKGIKNKKIIYLNIRDYSEFFFFSLARKQ